MVRVRPASADDRPQIREIQRRALAEPWPALLDVAFGDGPVCLVVEGDPPAEDGSQLAVGYAVALTADAPTAYVPELAVHPDAQGRGHGAALLAALLSTLSDRGTDHVRLTVREGDTRARSFYTERGFAVVDRVPDHFEADDGLVLERRCGRDADRQ